MRDLESDLLICEAATQGPWLVDYVVNQIRQPNCSKRRRITCPPDANGITDAQFIAEAREGWPEAIRRALTAEAEVGRLRKALTRAEDHIEGQGLLIIQEALQNG